MRQSGRIATEASRQAPGFLKLFDHETACLEALALWTFRLFAHLVRCTNYRTGAGSTSLAELVRLMTPIQPARGPRLYVPDQQAIKKALLAFERARILARDTGRSERDGLLFFMVSPRVAKVRPSLKLDPQTRTPVDKREASTHAG